MRHDVSKIAFSVKWELVLEERSITSPEIQQ
jgi:hypothetical protein